MCITSPQKFIFSRDALIYSSEGLMGEKVILAQQPSCPRKRTSILPLMRRLKMDARFRGHDGLEARGTDLSILISPSHQNASKWRGGSSWDDEHKQDVAGP
jgi:hypothetical protein